MLIGVLSVLLCRAVWLDLCLQSVEPFLPDDRHFFLRFSANLILNKYTCCRVEERDNTVFQLNSKSVGREAEPRLSRLPKFEGLRRRSSLLSAQLKLFVKLNFSV